jgi:hypothetical protein
MKIKPRLTGEAKKAAKKERLISKMEKKAAFKKEKRAHIKAIRAQDRRYRKGLYELNERMKLNLHINGQGQLIDITCELPSEEDVALRELIAQELSDMAIHYVSKCLHRVSEDQAVHLLISILDLLLQLDATHDIDFIMSSMRPPRFTPNLFIATLIATQGISDRLITRISFIQNAVEFYGPSLFEKFLSELHSQETENELAGSELDVVAADPEIFE